MDVLVLNADLGPLHRVSLRHAIRMLVRRVAEVHEVQADRVIGAYPVQPSYGWSIALVAQLAEARR